jgi:hypothetical protein
LLLAVDTAGAAIETSSAVICITYSRGKWMFSDASRAVPSGRPGSVPADH